MIIIIVIGNNNMRHTIIKFTKVQVPPYATSIFVFTLYYTIHTTCFGLIYKPSSGVIYKHNISKSYWPQRIRGFRVITTMYAMHNMLIACQYANMQP
jgi:hypothetical protein